MRITFLFILFFMYFLGFAIANSVITPGNYPTSYDYSNDLKYNYLEIDKRALSVPGSEDISIKKLTTFLIKYARNDREKARAIFRWITNNISYDSYSFLSGQYKKKGNLTAKEVLKKRKAVYGGYSNLFKAMGLESGLKCKFIRGYSKISNEKLARKLGHEFVDHAWNVVMIDGKWRFIETTWGAGNINPKTQKFVKKLNEFYFLTPANVFIYSHFPEDSD